MLIHAEQTDCFANVSQDFLICSTVHKARQLGVFTNDIYVRLSLGKAVKSTKIFSNSENPYFNEYFVFEQRCTLNELLRLTILYEVRKRTVCKKEVVLGALLIDLQSVWNQSNHCFFKKWGPLEPVVGGSKSAEQYRGYLQVDLAVVSQDSNMDALRIRASGKYAGGGDSDRAESHLGVASTLPAHLYYDDDDIDKNLLQDVESGVPSNIKYTIIFYKGVLVRKGDYMLQYRFHPFKGKTAVCKGTQHPVWNEEITFAGMYPSLANTFIIQLMMHEHLSWKSVAEVELYFDELAFKDKPLLGPTFLHLYDPLHPSQYLGRFLIEISSESLTTAIPRHLKSKSSKPFEDQRWWRNDAFLVEFVCLHGDFLHGNLSNLKLSLRLGENASGYVECYLKNYHSHVKATKHLKFFKQAAPYKAVHLIAQLPDHKLKFESDMFMQAIVNYMKCEIETFKLFQLKYTNEFRMQARCLKVVLLDMLSKLKRGIESGKLECSPLARQTAWDVNRGAYLVDFFRKLEEELKVMRQRLRFLRLKYVKTTVEEIVQELIKCTQELMGLLLTARIQDEWPDLLLVLSTGSKEWAVCRLNAKYFLVNRDTEDESAWCWRARNFVFKDVHCSHTCINCGCTIGVIQGCLSMIAEAERGEALTGLAEDWQQTEPFYWSPSVRFTNFKCRIYIHQAKIRPGSDRSGLADPYVRVLFAGQSGETNVEKRTLSPIWNQVISFERITLPGRVQWYELNPPVVAVEIYDADKYSSDDYLGSGLLPVSVLTSQEAKPDDDSKYKYNLSEIGRVIRTKLAVQQFRNLKNLSPPPLKWVSMAMNGAVRSEVLMAAELLVEEDVGELREKDSFVAPVITQGIPLGVRPIMRNYVLEVVFAGFRNYSKGGRHRVRIMMGDLQLNSGLSSSRIKNSINFLVIYASGVLSLPEQTEYWPSIIATDLLVSMRGAETTVGAVLISNSSRFLRSEERGIKCKVSEQVDAASSIASTSLQCDEEDEGTPLIEKISIRNKTSKALHYGLSLFKRSNFDDEHKAHADAKATQPIDASTFNWWTKFYNSMYPDADAAIQKHKLLIFNAELEKQVEYSYMHDWAEPMSLVHGVKYKKNAVPKEEVYGTLKLQLKLTPCQCSGVGGGDGDGDVLRPIVAALNPKYQSQLQLLNELSKIVVRVYIVQGLHIRPKDKNKHSDSYIRVQFGSKAASNRANYVPNTSNPIFGTVFQLEGVLPREHILEVSLLDRNKFHDEIVGSTYIDLEDRWRTRHRASVGLALEYSKNGYNQWRDVSSPYETLAGLCKQRDLNMPTFAEDYIEIDGEILTDETKIATDEEIQERLSLTALHNFERLPSFGYKLVPEHVETRSLYRKDYPGIEQGKIQLWVELYEGDVSIPPAIDITPLPPQEFELRATIINCSDVLLQESNVFGTRMSDIYVKGWCSDGSHHQLTDIHYRSLNGKGNFNWRMIFPIKYWENEHMMIFKVKSGFEGCEMKAPPVLVLQTWDNDVLSSNDFLGTVEINLSNFPEPFESASACSLPSDRSKLNMALFGRAESRNRINLFKKRKIRGWFPLVGPTTKKKKSSVLPATALTGKIEVELEMLPEAEASMNPCGLGREPPCPLPLPDRPETSFNPLTNPMLDLKKIIYPFCRKVCIYTCCIVLLGLLVMTFFLQIPTISLTAGAR